ncbi:MAG: LD-carboxypeptidase [Bacteroidales bacterium]|nr:LD-carboxypeptidase [Bacteroidales bacterium]
MKISNKLVLLAIILFCILTGSCSPSGSIQPAFLQPGDSIGVMVISSPINAVRRTKVDSMLKVVEEGLDVKIRLGEHLFKNEFAAFSVSDKERAEEFMGMVRNPNLKAILFYRGGYGAIRTLEYLDMEEIRRNPKWIVGFSDITTIHNVLSNNGIQSIHGGMPSSYWLTKRERPDSTLITVKNALYGKTEGYTIAPHPFNKFGEAEGILKGGNMTLITASIGTPYDLKVDENTVLFIEEVGERLNDIDRYMQQLEKSGKLGKIKALLVGSFTKMTDDEDPWNLSAYELIKMYTDKLDIPVIYKFPSGHSRPNYAQYLGREVKITVNGEGASIEFK